MIAPDSKTGVGGFVELSTIAGILPLGLIFKNQSSYKVNLTFFLTKLPSVRSFGRIMI
jgi:hypothetical protein